MVRDDREPGTDDEDHQEQVQEMLPAEPRRQPDRGTVREVGLAWVLRDEFLDPRELPDPLRHGSTDDEKEESDRDQP